MVEVIPLLLPLLFCVQHTTKIVCCNDLQHTIVVGCKSLKVIRNQEITSSINAISVLQIFDVNSS